jgi:predicted nucleic acid-binding protein
MNAIDTNVWIYCHDVRDPEKQKIAQRLIETVEPIVLLWQVGCEFIAAARKLEPFGFNQEQAWQSLADMQAMVDTVLLPTPELWPRCQAIQQQHGIHFWDAIIIATCIHYRVTTLYSEDIAENDDLHGLRIVNPFRKGETGEYH